MRTIVLVGIALAGMSLNTKTQSSRWQSLPIQRCIACSHVTLRWQSGSRSFV